MLLLTRTALTTVAVTFLALLIVSAYAAEVKRSDEYALGIEIALSKPFYIPASTGNGGMSAVVRTRLADNESDDEAISAVKLVPVVEGDKVKVTVSALVGDTHGIKTCKEWDSLKSISIDTVVAGLDEEVSIRKLSDYGVKFEKGDLKFRVVLKKVFKPTPPLQAGCGCADCGGLQCCPNWGFCLGCGGCGSACCIRTYQY